MNDNQNLDRRQFIAAGIAAAGMAALPGTAGAAPATDATADLPLTELARLLRSRELGARDLTQRYLDRIARHDGKQGLNSYLTVAGEAALKQAARLDAMAARGRFTGPLHGLPIAVKDNLDTAGLRTTGGSKILANWVPKADANAVARLKKAGAIVLGKTNMHEFAFGITTNNPHYGPTRNPYDRSRIPGGSSGGSGAAVAAALCAGALGTDTGGSVRIPAALCGVVGLKPTLGRVGRGGMMYLSLSRDAVGPITRTVADSALLLRALAGADPRDPGASSRPAPDYAAFSRGDLKGKRFGLPRKYFFDDLHRDTAAAMDQAVAAIRGLGGEVREVEVKNMDIATPTGFSIVLAEAVWHMENYLAAFDPGATIDKYLSQLGPDVQGALGSQKGTPNAKPVPGHVYVKALHEDRRRMIAGFEQAMRGVDALVLPTTSLPAAKIGDDAETELNGKKVNTFLTFIRNCDPVSVVGYPAISVPAGMSADGLPIGLQIVARPWAEMDLLAIAHAFEQATKVRRPPNLG